MKLLPFAGWNGKHCTLSGCPGNCNGHGQCKTSHLMSEWECWCDSGWFGAGCDVYMEKDCSDRKDNDHGETLSHATSSLCHSPLSSFERKLTFDVVTRR